MAGKGISSLDKLYCPRQGKEGREGGERASEGYAPEEKKGWDRPKTNESRRV